MSPNVPSGDIIARIAETAGPDLIGWDVLAVGRRQTHLFVTFGSPEPIRAERTLWIATSFEVQSSGATKSGGVGDLEPLVAVTVKLSAAWAASLS